MASNPLDEIASAVGPRLDLWQPRDWPHRRGDSITLDLLSFPLTETSSGRRPVPCEHCGQDCLCIHDNVMCWKCKGCFCYHCTNSEQPSGVTIPGVGQVMNNMFDVSRILGQGFGECHNCHEPLRAIAMVDVMRHMMESMGAGDSAFVGGVGMIGRNNPTSQRSPLSNTGPSLVQEAEDALKRAYDAEEGDNHNSGAISEYTHAINAINYLASSSQASRLVLRAKDILLIAHAKRACLEGNAELQSAILDAFPNASVKKSKGDVWHISKSAFASLFYPLPAGVMLAAGGSGDHTGNMMRIDMRNQTRSDAFKSAEWVKQLQIANMPTEYSEMFMMTVPHMDGMDALFDGLGGTWQGLCVHQSGHQMMSTVKLGDHSFTTGMVIQFVRVFPSGTAAKEYTRIIAEKKEIGEERSMNAKEDNSLKKTLKGMIKSMGVDDFHKVTVIKGGMGPIHCISAVVAVGNVSTKIFVQGIDEGFEPACYLAAKAISYLDRQLKEFRTTSQASMKEVPHHHPDLTLCAYCGKCSQVSLRTCSRCKLAKYCSVDCQRQHWEMKGPFTHKSFCKSVVHHT